MIKLIPKALNGIVTVVPLDWDFMTTKRAQGYKDMLDIWNYMMTKGVSERNAAAIMGNMMLESSFDPIKVQGGGDKAVGYFLMHGNKLKSYNNWLKTNNKTHSNYSQVDYILDLLAGNVEDTYMKEYNRVNNTRNALLAKKNLAAWEKKQLEEYNKYYNTNYALRVKTNTLYPYTLMIEMFNNPNLTLDEVTDIFTNSYERAGKPMYELRRRYASDIYERFRKKVKKKSGGKLKLIKRRYQNGGKTKLNFITNFPNNYDSNWLSNENNY